MAEHDPKVADALLTKHEQKMARAAKAKELREEGKTQQEIAEVLGVSQRTVSDDLAEKPVITEKPAKEPRKWIQYTIRNTTKPETAARRIREVFGDDFADALAESLMEAA